MYKKTSLLILALMALSGLSSCQKNYVCRCTSTSGYYYDSEIKTTKKKAKQFCDQQSVGTKTCVLQ